ncbi:MAG: hypothetical protein DWI24_03225 [Planctomycetota bacterium]|nr:MAG: hypothetical protein DWI24_03225 [Planctomycetota bacterium]
MPGPMTGQTCGSLLFSGPNCNWAIWPLRFWRIVIEIWIRQGISWPKSSKYRNHPRTQISG